MTAAVYQNSSTPIFRYSRSSVLFGIYSRHPKLIDCFETNVTFYLADRKTANSSLQESPLAEAHLVALRQDAVKCDQVL
jgi:hypothetical protein